jgi:hypothetical protein
MTIDERIARLERAVRWARWTNLLLFGLLLCVGGFSGWLWLGPKGTVRAKRIEIANAKGEAVVIETTPNGDGYIAIANSKGDDRVLLGTSRSGNGTAFFYTGEESPLVFIGGGEGGGKVEVFNKSKQSVAVMKAGATNQGAISVQDHNGNVMQAMGPNSAAYR